jgi:hypothetical protein
LDGYEIYDLSQYITRKLPRELDRVLQDWPSAKRVCPEADMHTLLTVGAALCSFTISSHVPYSVLGTDQTRRAPGYEFSFGPTGRVDFTFDRSFLLGGPSFPEWCVFQFVDGGSNYINGHLRFVRTQSVLDKVNELRTYIDTVYARRVLEHHSDYQSKEVSRLDQAVAVAFIADSGFRRKSWLRSPGRGIVSSLGLLRRYVPGPSTKSRISLLDGIACLALVRITNDSKERVSLLRLVAARSGGPSACLGLCATTELCRESLRKNQLSEATKWSEFGLEAYKSLSEWTNYQNLLLVRRYPGVPLKLPSFNNED